MKQVILQEKIKFSKVYLPKSRQCDVLIRFLIALFKLMLDSNIKLVYERIFPNSYYIHLLSISITHPKFMTGAVVITSLNSTITNQFVSFDLFS